MSILDQLLSSPIKKVLQNSLRSEEDIEAIINILLESGDALLLEDGGKILEETQLGSAIKISEMVDGGEISGSDQILIERGSSNFRVNVNQIFTDMLTKQSISEKGAVNGYAGLDGNAVIPIDQLDTSHLHYRDFIFDLNLGKTNGYYQFTDTASNKPSNFPSTSNFNIIEVFPYQTNNGTQIIYSADYDSASSNVFQYIRSWESNNFTNWYKATMTQVV